jgi:hypothetical protein
MFYFDTAAVAAFLEKANPSRKRKSLAAEP